MNDQIVPYSDGDVDTNRSDNASISEIIDARYSRRSVMGGFGATVAVTAMSSTILAACTEGGGTITGGGETVVLPTASSSTTAGKVASIATPGEITSGLQITQTGGPAVTLSSTTAANPTFAAPAVTAPTALTFSVAGTDATGVRVASTRIVNVGSAVLGFNAVAKNRNDVVTVPAGYTATVLYAGGETIDTTTPAYVDGGNNMNYDKRAGDHHDGMYYFGLAATGTAPDPNNSTRGLLAINHENITEAYLHPNGVTFVGGVRPENEALREMENHGVSVIEVTRAGNAGAWSINKSSAFNRRITPLTPMSINGPVRGHPLVQTAFSPTGVAGRGTINNCANGFTPWGTYLTCEENWAGYFRRRSATDNPQRTAKELVGLQRYSVGGGPLGGGANSWFSVAPADPANTIYLRWTAEVSGASATADFRNEANQFGWTVEIDPYDPTSTPRKRTAQGRMAKEGAWPGRFIAGTRPAWYMGDDSTGDYCYKFVSATPWVPADATAANRLATGDKYLDTGTLYVARFNADGSGVWLPLIFGTAPLTAANAAYSFADQADVLVHPRLAGDALGATRMDRPEWTAVNPANGEMYLTLTNASTRGGALPLDAANPRVYQDPPSAARGNRNGHIIRLREAGDTTEALTFTWDIYVFGAGSDLDAVNINVSNLSADNDLSSPDGLWFSRTQNAGGNAANPLLWVQTDDGAFTDVTNCMMLVGQPGRVGDGTTKTITNTLASGATVAITTKVGALPGTNLRRFMVSPRGAEITGIDSTPDGRTVFINIQHPGETGSATPPSPAISAWPASQTNPAATTRPRSATIVITKDDGGVVGV